MSLTCHVENSLPGAIAMYGLSLGIGEIDDVLPGIIYALLSGLNASTVGIIALSAVQVWYVPDEASNSFYKDMPYLILLFPFSFGV